MRNSNLLLCASLAVFCVAAALSADVLFSHLIRHGHSAEAARVNRAINDLGGPKEIPIFGASKAAQDYLPEVLGPHYFNYGFSRASPAVTNLLLSFKLEEKSNAPIVIDLHQAPIDDLGDVRNFIPFATLPKVRALLKQHHVWRWYYGVPGLRYFGSYDGYLKDTITDFLPGSRQVYSEAFTGPWERQTFEPKVAARLKNPIAFGLLEDQRREMISLIRSAPERKFIIVLSPLHWSFLKGAKGEAQYRATLDSLRALPNVQLIDFTRTDYPDEYFKDPGHLNLVGARVFSAQLRAAIESGVSTSYADRPGAGAPSRPVQPRLKKAMPHPAL